MVSVRLGDLVFHGDGEAQNGWVYRRLQGWYSAPPVRGSLTDRPNMDGAFGFVKAYRSARALTFEGSIIGSSSSAAVGDMYRRFAAIQADGRPFELEVTDPSGSLTMMVTINGSAEIDELNDFSANVTVPLLAPDPVKYGPSRTYSTGLPRPGGGLEYELFNGPPIPLPANYVYVQGAAPDRENVFWLNPDAASVPLAYNGDPGTMPTPVDVLVASTIPEGYAGQFVYDPLTYELKENPTYG